MLGVFLGLTLIGAPNLSAAPGVLYVGPLEQIKKIQDAVDVIVEGGTIHVRNGIYFENIEVDKRVTIQSDTGYEHATVIAADPDLPVFEVTASNVTIDGFTIYGATNAEGILLETPADGCTLIDNRIGLDASHYNRAGIYVRISDDNTIRGNRVLNNVLTGILLSNAHSNLVEDNYCSLNSRGISLSNSTNNIVSENVCVSNTNTGIHLVFELTTANHLTGNTCGHNRDGFLLEAAHGNLLTGNVSNLNDNGISFLHGATNNLTKDNEFNGNSDYGIHLHDSDDNTFYLNDISLNTRGNVYSYGSTNTWNTPGTVLYYYEGGLPYTDKNIMGNFYNDHGLADLDTDGIADGSYPLPREEPADTAPLTSERRYYDFHVRNCYPNQVVEPGEDISVLGSMTVLNDPDDTAVWPLLIIEGKLTVGGF